MLQTNQRKDSGIIGHVDFATNKMIAGWAFNRANPEDKVVLEILVNNILYKTVVAENFRGDLSAAGYSDGCCGFSVYIGKSRKFGSDNQVVVRVKGSGQQLHGSPRAMVIETPKKEIKVNPAEQLNLVSVDGAPVADADYTGKSVVLYAIHTWTSEFSPTHIAVAQRLKQMGFTVIAIDSRDSADPSMIAEATDLFDTYIIRNDSGRDFASWVSVLQGFYRELSNANFVLLLNDSVIGPLNTFEESITSLCNPEVDVSALTDSWQGGYHIQTSCFVITKAGMAHPAIVSFLEDYPFPKERDDVVKLGEIGFTKKLLLGSVKIEVLSKYHEVADIFLSCSARVLREIRSMPALAIMLESDASTVQSMPGRERNRGWSDYIENWMVNVSSDLIAGIPRNPQHVFWDILIRDFKYPFIKRELVCHNPENVPTLIGLNTCLEETDNRGVMQAILFESCRLASKAPTFVSC